MTHSELLTRLWSKVQVSGLDECWPWLGSLDSGGYGRFSGRRWGWPQKANRAVYLATRGELPDGMMIRHLCHHRECCNPLHLAAGTCQDNMDDQLNAGRRVKGNKHHSWNLSERQRKNIRASELPNRELARMYGVSEQFISHLKCG